ncbi:MAG: serine/threonine protein kinase [Nitrospirae bacterium]|nr:serine/threonine protein kinase [Nitrospirota bacterium]
MIIRDYELDEMPLGKGGMGTVYKAHHAHLHAERAIKVIVPDPAEIVEKRKRFLAEARIQFDLKHPNIVEVYDCFEEDSRFYIVMEYVRGKTLKALIENRYRLTTSHVIESSFNALNLDEATCVDIICQCLDALAHAHSRKIIHRDMKPANVIMTLDSASKPVAKLTDFGIAKINADSAEESLTKTGMTLGTAHYMAPEQMESTEPGSVDHRADLYALGITMFETLTGDLPFGDRSTSIMKIMYNKLHNTPPNLPVHRDSISPALYRIIEKAIKQDRRERFQSAGDFKKALLLDFKATHQDVAGEKTVETYIATETMEKTVKTTPGKSDTGRVSSPKSGGRKPGLGLLIPIAVIAIALVIILGFTNHNKHQKQQGADIVATVTNTPASAGAPTVTQTPIATETPTNTEIPTTTGTPTNTEIPTTTGTPTNTEIPTATKTPTITKAPTVTKMPKITKTPTVTRVPTTAKTPSITEAPIDTEAEISPDDIKEASFVRHIKEIRATYRQLRLRAIAGKLNADIYDDQERRSAWQWLKGQKATLFGLARKIEKRSGYYEITLRNPRVKMDGFNFIVEVPRASGHPEPVVDHILIFEGTLSDYLPAKVGTPAVLVIDGATILEVIERERFKNLREQHPVFPAVQQR